MAIIKSLKILSHSSKMYLPPVAFLGLSSSFVSAQQPFPSWVDISQHYLMHIWPLMLSLCVLEPEAQLKLTTQRPFQPPGKPSFAFYTSFGLTYYFPSQFLLSTHPLLPSCCYATLLFFCLSYIPNTRIILFPYMVLWQSIIYENTDSAFLPIWIIVLLEN